MGKNSHIEWTHHTFNPWWGCAKVSPACEHCYAESWAKRVGSNVWGRKAPRRFFGDEHWRQPLAWNAEAARRKSRARVFCASMADVFEDRRDLDASRERLWGLIFLSATNCAQAGAPSGGGGTRGPLHARRGLATRWSPSIMPSIVGVNVGRVERAANFGWRN
jgi:hypothetical protein